MRVLRVVKLCIGDRQEWAVVSASNRDDDTWDVINRCDTREAALRYVDDVYERNHVIRKAGLG